ncbi:MAG: hypothetical protein JST00_01940 [Deltaproteobacteria bacterium]|nr:hypothetical protein [Deltaproteobacteria bacterium]
MTKTARWRGLAGLGIALALSQACDDGPIPLPPPSPAVVLYGAQKDTRLSPWPSNRYARTDATTKTGLRLDLRADTSADQVVREPSFAGTVSALNRLDGFSTIGPLVVGFSKEIDPAGAEKAMRIVDVDDASPTKGKAIEVLPLYYSTVDSDAVVEDYTLLVHPLEPLRQRTRYAFVMGEGIRTAKDGAPVVASSGTERLLSDEPGEYAESVRRALPVAVTATGWAKESVRLATVFTTASVRDVVEAIGIERRAAPPPRQASPFTLEKKGEGADKRARFVGRFEAPEYRRAKPPSGTGTFDVGPDGRPVLQKTTSLEAYLAFSDATRSGPRPVVVFGHGLGGDKDSVWGTAERLAQLGVVVVGIDAPEHGSRSDPPTKDGKSDLFQSVTGFFAANPETKQFDMERVRDNFRQMGSDQLELVRFLQTLGSLDLLPLGAPDGIPDLDTSRILYLGHSFGSVLGPLVGALSPEIVAACWNVGGNGLATLIRDSGLFSILVDAFRPPGTPKADVAKFFAIAQAILDPGDPGNYARFTTLEPLPGVVAWRPKDVLLQEVQADTIVPNTSTEILARALGLPLAGIPTHPVPGAPSIGYPVRANLPSGATGALVQFETADGKTATHGELIFTDAARRQYVEFFRTALEGRAIVVAP